MGGRGTQYKKERGMNQQTITLQQDNIKQEVLAGITTFISSAYIIMTNALILSDAGISSDAAMIATIFTCAVSTFLMGIVANSPFIVVPGMGINSLFTYTIVNSMGLSWQSALGAVFVSGIIFTIIASTKITPILMKSIPNNLKHAITVGVGFLILFIGLQKSGLVVSNENTLVSLGNLSDKEIILTLITLFIILILDLRKVNGGILISILIGTLLSMLMKITSISDLDFTSFNIAEFKNVFLTLSFKDMFSIPFFMAVLSITVVIVFENMGILYGMLGALNKEDKFQKTFALAGISNMVAGMFGTSPTIVAAENFSGISAGGKGKIAALTSGVLFLMSLFLIPVLKIIPNSVISAVLIFIGILMIQTFFDLEKGDIIDTISIAIIITLIPLTYNIVNGIACGFIVYTILNIAYNQSKKVSPAMYVLTGLFILNFILSTSIGLSH